MGRESIMRKIGVGSKHIGEEEPCFIIAEADFRGLLTL
jgi:hypothetical protein